VRVVLDTNVFVSSFFGGQPKRVIDLWKTGRLLLCLSKPIVDEYVAGLSRMGLANENELQQLLGLFRAGVHTLYAGTTPQLRVVRGDPTDDRFIECAVALEADYIVSVDKHLLQVETYMGITMVTPAEFLRRLNG